MTVALPAELVDTVFGFCDGDTLKSCRLASRLFNSIASTYAFETVHIALFRENLENFIHIASHPKLSTCVKSLVFHGQVPRKFRSRKDWEKFIDLRPNSSSQFSRLALGASKDPLHQALPKHNKSKAELQHHWLQYRAFEETLAHVYGYLQAVSEGVGPEYAVRKSSPVRFICDNFSRAVSQLPNLVSATLRAHDFDDDKHPFWRRIQQRVLLMPYQWKQYYTDSPVCYDQFDHQMEGVVQLSMLLTALAGLPSDRKLRTLNIKTERSAFWLQRHLWSSGNLAGRTFTQEILQMSWYRQSLNSMKPAFSTITNLHLDVDYALGDDHNTIADHVSRFLHQANSLVSLNLTFMEDNMDEESRCDLLAKLYDVSWPKIRRLNLHTMTSGDGFLGVLTAVAPTLRELDLRHVMLFRGSGIWDDVLKRIPQIVKLDSIHLDGLWDSKHTEDEDNDENEDGRYLFEDFWDYEHDHHCQDLYNYLTRRSTKMPPLDEGEFLEAHEEDCVECRGKYN